MTFQNEFNRLGITWVPEYEINWIIQYLRQFWEDSTKLLIKGSTISSSWGMQSADWSFDCVVESSKVNWFYTSAQKHVYTCMSFTVLTRKNDGNNKREKVIKLNQRISPTKKKAHCQIKSKSWTKMHLNLIPEEQVGPDLYWRFKTDQL